MLNVAILDGVERLSDQLSNATKFQCGIISSGDSTASGSLAQSLLQWRSNSAICPSTDYSKIWFTAYAGTTPANKCALFDVATETIAFDDSGARGLTQILNDPSGAVWAQGTVSGFYGLWKRTGAGAWTQMLSDSGVGTGIRWRPADGSLWYQSYTNNHYSLANGTAALSAAPTGTLLQVAQAYGWNNLDAPYLATANSGQFNNSVFKNVDNTVNPSISLPYDAWLNYGSPSGTGIYLQVHIDATYSLFVAANSASTTYFLYLFNKSSGVIRCIGTLPVLSVKSTVSSTSDLKAFAAKWTAAGLRIFFIGNLIGQDASYTTSGILRVDYAYQPNF